MGQRMHKQASHKHTTPPTPAERRPDPIPAGNPKEKPPAGEPQTEAPPEAPSETK